MPLMLADRVKETSTSTGTGSFVLAGGMLGFRPFSAVCAVGDKFFYVIQGVDSGGGVTSEWECGYGTYSAANTVSRTTVLASSNAGALVAFSAGTTQVAMSFSASHAAWIREKLAANRTYYVATTGSNSNDGLSVGAPFLTVQKAVDTIAALDLNGYSATVQLADGTYTAPVTMKPLVGGSTIAINGNATTPANVVISTSGASCVTNDLRGTEFSVTNLKLTSTYASGFLLMADKGGRISFGNIDFGACAYIQIAALGGAQVAAVSGYTISGGGSAHWFASFAGQVIATSMTITITGTPSFGTAFAYAAQAGMLRCYGLTFSGVATGTRYSATTFGLIYSGTATSTYLPGNNAGSVSTPSYGYYGP